MIDRLLGLYHMLGYRWKMGKDERIPTKKDLEFILDKTAKTLYTEDDWTQAQIGRLIIQKVAGHIDVYIYVGDYNDTTNDERP